MNLKKDWKRVLLNLDANYAVTLAYNPHIKGSYEPTYRLKENGNYQQITGRIGVGNRLTTMRNITKQIADKDTAFLAKQLDRKLLGSRYHKKPSIIWSKYAGFIEHANSNFHIHLMWKCHDPHGKAPRLIEELWHSFDRNHLACVKPITDAIGWADYILKEQTLRDLKNLDFLVLN